jgi:uncharacterized lipoprotein YddW (UPF0748 family)
MLRAVVRSLVIAALAATVAVSASVDGGVRALWVVRTSLTSPAAIDRMVTSARAAGFNTLLVQVRGRGDAYFAGGLDPRPSLLAADRDFDPLETTVARAHAAGLRVHAWINVNLVAGANELPASRDHVIYRHPEWLMVPRAIAEDLRAIEPRSPEYLGRLTRYTRSQSSEIEGLYLSPIDPASAAYTTSVVRDIVARYAVDGVHLDYVRYPNETFDYSRAALDAFRAEVGPELAAGDRHRLDTRARTEPLIYTRSFPERWRTFRAARMTRLVGDLSSAIRNARPGALVSAAVVPVADDAVARRLQDWRTWIDTGLVDVVCPMAYTTDADLFATQIAGARDTAGTDRVWAGIGAYRLSSAQIVDNIMAARRLGVGGIILFSYDSLTAPGRGADYLAQVGRAAFSP